MTNHAKDNLVPDQSRAILQNERFRIENVNASCTLGHTPPEGSCD